MGEKFKLVRNCIVGFATSLAILSSTAQVVPSTFASSRVQTANKEELNSRIADLTALGTQVPENELVLFDELKRLEEEQARLARQLRTLQQRRDQVAEVDGLRQRADRALQGIAVLDCKTVQTEVVRAAVRAFESVAEEVNSSYPGTRRDDPWVDIEMPSDREHRDPVKYCNAVKRAANVDAKRATYMSFIENLRAEITKRLEQDKEIADLLSKTVELVQKRRSTLQKGFADRSTQQQLSENLWKVISVIGVLALLAIFMIKQFPESLQLEWVSSGQVIQFVTVMLLLSVVMALGLGGILKEQTLGTLLGSIAGYVLAQGVGREAARQATRRLEQRTPESRRPHHDDTG